MRIFGLAGLMLALLIVGLLARKQMAGSPPAAIRGASGASAAASDPRAQAQRMQEQIRRSVAAAMQAPRPVPEEP